MTPDAAPTIDPLTQAEKDTWMAALVSGEYQQGNKVLFDPVSQRYCCLGVLKKVCNVQRVESVLLLVSRTANATLKLSYDTQTELARMNDDGVSFTDIAAWIDAHIIIPSGT